MRPDLATNQDAVEGAVRHLWSCVGRIYAEFPAMRRIVGAGHVHIDGLRRLDAAISHGEQAILLFVHTGSWELSGMDLAMRYPDRILAIFSPLGSRQETAYAMRARRTMPARFAPMSRTVWRQALLHLRKPGALLWIAADEWDRGQVKTPAFGRGRSYDGNLGKAVRLAKRTGAAIVPMCSERLSGRDIRTHILPVLDPRSSITAACGFEEMVDALDDMFAHHIVRLADQWYMALHIGEVGGGSAIRDHKSADRPRSHLAPP